MTLFYNLTKRFASISILLLSALPIYADGDHGGTCAEASVVGPGGISGVHENAADADYFRLSVGAGGVLTVQLTAVGPEPRLQFLGRDCTGDRTAVRYLEKSDVIQAMLIDQAGDYFFAVVGPATGSTGSYTLSSSFSLLPAQTTQQITLPLDSVALCDAPEAPQVDLEDGNDLIQMLDGDPVDDDGSGDQVVVIVVDQFGAIWIGSDSLAATGSLYTADTCDSKSQLFGDERLAGSGTVWALEAGTYYLRLRAVPAVSSAGSAALAVQYSLQYVALPSLG